VRLPTWYESEKRPCLRHGEGYDTSPLKRVLQSNFGCCIGTIQKSQTYKISGAAERRKFLYANLFKTKERQQLRKNLLGRTAQQRIEGLQNEILFAWRELLDALHAAKHTAAGLAAQGLRAVGPEQFIRGDFEGGGKADGHLSGEPELAALVVRDQGLNDADALGQFGLGVAAFFPEPRDPMVQRLAASVHGGHELSR